MYTSLQTFEVEPKSYVLVVAGITCPASVPAAKKVCTPPVKVADVVSKLSVASPVVAPPDNPLPATILLISPAAADVTSVCFASLCPPAVEPSWTITVFKSVSTVISPTKPVKLLCWLVVPRLH